MNFARSIEALKGWRKAPGETAHAIFAALCGDLSPGKVVPDVRPIATHPDDPIFRPLSHLSWWGGDSRAQLTDFTGHRTGLLLDTDYDVAWLDVALGTGVGPARMPDPTLRAFHEECIRGLGGEDLALVGRLRDALVLFVTVHGKGMAVPDLYVAGPAHDATGGDYLIGVLPLRLSKAVAGAAGDVAAASAYLAKLQGLARGAGPGQWRSMFGTTGEVREVFRKQMAERLARLMVLLEDTVGRRADEQGLVALREAATLLVFRLMFLMELEGRRGLLYQPGMRPLDRLSLFELADTETARRRKDSLLVRLQELTEHIRKGTGGVALSGASIFDNAPNDNFDPAVTAWLDDFDKKARRSSVELRDAWHDALASIGPLVTGQVEVYSQGAPVTSAVGLGGSEHVQRVLGDVYEQILAMSPKRDRNGSPILVAEGSEGKNERKTLAAHYTPEGMVIEMVRPLVGVLFRDAWARSHTEPVTYRKSLLDLHVVDPAMGSAHFLTVVALEIAKELAWVDVFGCPQPETHFEMLQNRDPWAGVEKALNLKDKLRGYLPEVVRRCCYGVDIKPLACELGKLALWLFTMTAEPEERPALTFVDGNVRSGDSLVGVTWKDAVAILRERLDWDPARRDTLFGSKLSDLRKELEEVSAEIRAASGDLREWLVLHGETANDLPGDDHLLRQRGLKKMHEKVQEIRWAYDLAVLALWYPTPAELLRCLHDVAPDARLLPRDAEKLVWGDLMMGEGIYTKRARDCARASVRALAKTHRAFHWELEFPDVMDGRKFDGVVANPPFRGDRDLKDAIGEPCKDYLRTRFTDGVVLDHASFFVLRYDELAGDRGVIGTLATNTLAQGKNRRLGLKPLLMEPRNNWIFRAVRNRPWPGEAAVFICAVHIARPTLPRSTPMMVSPEYDDDGNLLRERIDAVPSGRISSYLDGFAETDPENLMSMSDSIAQQGMQHMGPFECEVDFLRKVPKRERAALRAYLDNKDVQQQPEPIAPRLLIDVYDALVDAELVDAETSATSQLRWLEKNLPTLVVEMKRQRGLGVKSSDRERWWMFHRTRADLRKAWEGLDQVLLIGRHVKVFSPALVPMVDPVHQLRICPSDALVVVVADSLAFTAVLSSFPCELHVRRSCSTIKTDLRVTPTEAFPGYPLPWAASWSKEKRRPVALPPPVSIDALLVKPMQAVVALRRSLLAGKDRAKLPTDRRPGGPTDLYNLYDNPDVKFPVIAELRALHVALTDAVLQGYGWHEDGPDGPPLRLEWGFDRPWIDGTTRYVPNAAGRQELVVRLAGCG